MSETPSKLQKTQQDFKNFYDTQLREEYAKLELSRQKYLKMVWRNLIILSLFLIFADILVGWIAGFYSCFLYCAVRFIRERNKIGNNGKNSFFLG